MALNLYTYPTEDFPIETGNILTFTFDGATGGLLTKQVFLRNDDEDLWYSGITIDPYVLSGDDITNNSISGWYWKLAKSNKPLTQEEWGEVTKGNTLTISENIGSSSKGDIFTYISIWVLVRIPASVKVKTLKGISLRISATENLVG